MENLNYNHLYYFWMIAKEGGVTSASRKLNLAQPTLSAQLKLFEDHMGGVLFERKARKLFLNDLGKIIFDYADSIFKKSDEMLHAIRNRDVVQVTSVNVGVQADLNKKTIHGFIKSILANAKYNVNLVSRGTAQLLAKLKSLEIDVAITDKPAPSEEREIVSQHASSSPVIFVAAPQHKSLRRKFPHSLASENVFLPSEVSPERKAIDDYFKNAQITPRIKGAVEDEEMLRVLAVSGVGVVAINRAAVSDLIKTKALYIIGDDLSIWKNFYLLTVVRNDQHKIVTDLLDKFKV